MRDSLEKNLEPIETRFKYLRIPKKILYANLYPLSKVVYCLFMLDNFYTSKRVSEVLYKNHISNITRCINELRDKEFIKCEKYLLHKMVLLVDDTECIKIPFELLYKMNTNALIYYAVLKDMNCLDVYEIGEKLKDFGFCSYTINNYVSLYKKLNLIK